MQIDAYLLGEIPTIEGLKDGPASITALPPTASVACYAAQVLSVHPGDTAEFRFIKPSKEVAVSLPISHSVYYRHSFWWACASAGTLNAEPGIWQAEYHHNGALVSVRSFGVGGVGGIAELPEVAGTPLETGGSSGSSAGVLAGAIAGAVTATLALGGAAWYARRQWWGRHG